MDLNEMRRRFKEQKEQKCRDGGIDYLETTSESASHTFRDEETNVKHIEGDKQTVKFEDGATYSGSVDENGYLHGYGVYTYPDGMVYDGLFENGDRNGRGTQIWPDGAKYIGSWKNGMRSGNGTMTWPDGASFIGRWKDDNLLDGIYYYSDGAHYSGQFNSNWEKNGYGTYYWPDGSYHFGQWKNDKRHGEGQLLDSNGELTLEGEWFNDEFQDSASTVCGTQDVSWKEATQRAVNLLFQLETCSFSERCESLSIIKSFKVPPKYNEPWLQILRIWDAFVNDLRVDTQTLPNPDGVRYNQRPFPILGSSGVQEVIKEIIKNV